MLRDALDSMASPSVGSPIDVVVEFKAIRMEPTCRIVGKRCVETETAIYQTCDAVGTTLLDSCFFSQNK